MTYDHVADAAYLYLVSEIANGSVDRTVPSGIYLDSANIVFDFDADDRLLGIEILGASRVLAEEVLAAADSIARDPQDDGTGEDDG